MKGSKLKKILSSVLVAAVICAMSVAFVACNKNGGTSNTVRFVMPDGTPALSAARLFADNKKIDGKDMEYALIGADSVVGEMKSEKADVLIMPTNLGVQQIVKNAAPYRLVSVNVEGNLYVICNPNKVGGSAAIALDELKGKKVACIGEGGTPDLIFKYIAKGNNLTIGAGENDIHVFYVAEAPMAKNALVNGDADFAIVPEPAATQFGAAIGCTSRLDIQAEYKALSGSDNFPQAGMFVKTSLLSNAAFMSELKAALTASVTWVTADANKAVVGAFMKDVVKSTSTFPPASIARANVCAKFMTDDIIKKSVFNYLTIMGVDTGIFG